MTGTFAAAARRLAGLAGIALGWSPDAFWAATPADLSTMVMALAGHEDGAAPPDAATIARLQKEFPDE